MSSIDFPPIPEGQFELYADVSVFLPVPTSLLMTNQLYAKEGRGDDLERHLRILIRLTESEAGTLEYAIARDDEDPNHFQVFERYTGREAFEQHIGAQELVDFANSGVLAQPPNPKFLHALKPL